jgi:hypothetical protein
MGTPRPAPANDMDTWYTRCPMCRLVGPPQSATYQREPAPASGVDWSYPVVVTCIPSGHEHAIGVDDLEPHDATHTCSRCSGTTPVPAAAAQVVCLSCRLYAAGPAAQADDMVAMRLRSVEQAHAIALRDALRAAGFLRDPNHL